LIVSHDLTILSMILNASIVVKVVMALLVLASMLSWTYIFMKMFAIRRARRQADEFEREFWGGSDLVGLYQRAASGRYAASGMERIFEAGFKEFLKLKGRAGADMSSSLPSSPITASATTSIASPAAMRASWRSCRTSCSARRTCPTRRTPW
jgi:biopolymer transport protein TolQ